MEERAWWVRAAHLMAVRKRREEGAKVPISLSRAYLHFPISFY
jgi:hypothetical protein